MSSNPLLDLAELPRFADFQPSQVAPAVEQLLQATRAAIQHAETIVAPSWETLIDPLDDANERLARAWSVVGHLQAVANTPELREAYNENLPKISQLWSEQGQNLALFAQYQALAASADYATFSPAKRRVIDNALRDFRLGGAQLNDADKQKFTALREELSKLSARFEHNVLDATDAFAHFVVDEAELAGLPADAKAAARRAAEEAGQAGWKLTLQMPSYLPVLQYAENRALRETMYHAFSIRASELGNPDYDNSALIARIVAARQELAALLGLATYADYSLVSKMAESPAQVLTFLRDLAARAKPFALRDRAELEAFAATELGIAELQAWDVAYASAKLEEAKYRFSAQAVKQYFTEPRVLAGLFGVIERLYGIKVEPDTAPTWHPDVRFYRLVDQAGQLLGQFYLDLYARSGKRGGAWMDDARNRRKRGDVVQTPLVYLVCNFGRGEGGKPATFTHDEVITLFHEMGHGLHQLLTQVDELSVAGINGVEWDAVELPSQFMENFCWEWEQISAMSAHVDTGEPLPRELFDKMLAAKNFQSGMATVRQLEFSLFDMELHYHFDPAQESILGLLTRVRDEVAVNHPPAYNRTPHSFGHLFGGGYAAGYYSYKWAEVLSADAYSAFEAAPNDLAATGKRFWQEVLAVGGSRPAMASFKAFRGREPNLDALLRHHGMAEQPV